MAAAAIRESSWLLNNMSGVLRSGSLTGCVDVPHPELGLSGIQLFNRNLGGRLFCARRSAEEKHTWPLAVADAYVRGADLVASYQPAPEWPYAPQIYWRSEELDSCEGLAGSLSLLVSVQTHLLDTHPRISVSSQVATSDVFCIESNGKKGVAAESIAGGCTIQSSQGVCCLVRRLAEIPFSYAEFMQAGDFQALHVRSDGDGTCHAEWALFAEFLEKGVIRRARLHGAFLRRENDLELAAACINVIERASLPLTT